MIKCRKLQPDDKVAIVSLSSGILGEDFCQHYIELGTSRLMEFGLQPVFMKHTLAGVQYVQDHPEKRAEDLKAAFLDDEIKGIICAIGGEDTYRTIQYLLEDEEFKAAVKTKPKLFTGFSDTTVNHLMFHKLGLTTYYGPSYINDFADASSEMLSYTHDAVADYYMGENITKKIVPSDLWYEERVDFSPKSLGVDRVSHKETHGFELIQGKDGFTGRLLGGCLESLYELITGEHDIDQKYCNDTYQIFPEAHEWKDKILFIETSEEKPDEMVYRKYLRALKEKGVFQNIAGIIHGKPQDEVGYEIYKKVIVQEVGDESLPIVFNVNFGHAYPRTILAYGAKVFVSTEGIKYLENLIEC